MHGGVYAQTLFYYAHFWSKNMIQGLYTASRGMTPLMQQQDQIANNLANIHTTGYKQSGLFIKSYQKYLENDLLEPFANQDIKADEVYIDYREGVMKATKQPLDLFIKGSGFFKIMSDDGIQYTRNGNFSLNHEGLIVTSTGARLMGTNGFIRVERDLPLTVTDQGKIIQNNETKAVIAIVDFEKPYSLKRNGDSSFTPLLPGNHGKQSPGYVLKQGYLEGSNVDMVRNMVQMISSYRTFEADQKALHAQDETLEKSVNQVGRVG
jgi:flagellar basal-body rod protein FlgF